jgi:hypothetical protein
MPFSPRKFISFGIFLFFPSCIYVSSFFLYGLVLKMLRFYFLKYPIYSFRIQSAFFHHLLFFCIEFSINQFQLGQRKLRSDCFLKIWVKMRRFIGNKNPYKNSPQNFEGDRCLTKPTRLLQLYIKSFSYSSAVIVRSLFDIF